MPKIHPDGTPKPTEKIGAEPEPRIPPQQPATETPVAPEKQTGEQPD